MQTATPIRTEIKVRGDAIERVVTTRSGSKRRSVLPLPGGKLAAINESIYDQAWLTAPEAPKVRAPRGTIRTVDLFAGCGGLSIGIREACRALQLECESILAVDFDAAVLSTYAANFPEAEVVCAPIETLIDGVIGAPLTPSEKALKRKLGQVDLVVGGPPCQGNSALNNHTRHNDPKNELYLVMARFCEIVRPTHVIIENVPGVLKDRRNVAQRTWSVLESLGYHVDSGVIDASKVGVAQRRRRSLTLASLALKPSIQALLADAAQPVRPVSWAIGDLLNLDHSSVFDSAPHPSPDNRRRIDFLFDQELYELPDSERPDCHRLKDHSYKSIYGRMHWNLPAQTITTGFGSMGRGRNVHAQRRRTITPHEAARIQFFPDFFGFATDHRTQLQKMIGNAVPQRLGYVVALHLLGS